MNRRQFNRTALMAGGGAVVDLLCADAFFCINDAPESNRSRAVDARSH